MKIELMIIIGITFIGNFNDSLTITIKKKQIEAITNLQNIMSGGSA